MVGAGDAKGLGRFGLDARAVAQHHRPDESLLGTRQDVPEQGFPDVLPRPRRGVAEPPDAGPAELLDEPAALDVAVGVSAVAPGLGRGVEGAGRAEAVGQAQDLFGIVRFRARRRLHRIGEHVVDRLNARGADITDPGYLHGRWLTREHPESMPGRNQHLKRGR